MGGVRENKFYNINYWYSNMCNLPTVWYLRQLRTEVVRYIVLNVPTLTYIDHLGTSVVNNSQLCGKVAKFRTNLVTLLLKRNSLLCKMQKCERDQGTFLTLKKSFFIYFCRKTKNVGSDFNWSSSEQGIILGAFFYGYIVTQIPGAQKVFSVKN